MVELYGFFLTENLSWMDIFKKTTTVPPGSSLG